MEAVHSVEPAENSVETGTKHILSQMSQVQPNVPSNSFDLHGTQRNSLYLGEELSFHLSHEILQAAL